MLFPCLIPDRFLKKLHFKFGGVIWQHGEFIFSLLKSLIRNNLLSVLLFFSKQINKKECVAIFNRLCQGFVYVSSHLVLPCFKPTKLVCGLEGATITWWTDRNSRENSAGAAVSTCSPRLWQAWDHETGRGRHAGQNWREPPAKGRQKTNEAECKTTHLLTQNTSVTWQEMKESLQKLLIQALELVCQHISSDWCQSLSRRRRLCMCVCVCVCVSHKSEQNRMTCQCI